jgi:hypothetical protein
LILREKMAAFQENVAQSCCALVFLLFPRESVALRSFAPIPEREVPLDLKKLVRGTPPGDGKIIESWKIFMTLVRHPRFRRPPNEQRRRWINSSLPERVQTTP